MIHLVCWLSKKSQLSGMTYDIICVVLCLSVMRCKCMMLGWHAMMGLAGNIGWSRIDHVLVVQTILAVVIVVVAVAIAVAVVVPAAAAAAAAVE